jgi:basic membrane protein A
VWQVPYQNNKQNLYFMKKILVAFFLFSVIFSFAAIKVGFIYVGPVGDSGWTYAHDLGRQYLVKKLGNKVQTNYIENIRETQEAADIMRSLADRGYKLIFIPNFGYMDPALRVAAQFPNVVFMDCSGYKTAKNLGTYFGRMYQPRFLSGMIAGAMTKTNKIGYVAARPVSEVIRGINAFTLGVQAVNPNAKVHVIWTNTWYDPATEKEAALSLLSLGCDVLAQHQDSPATLQAAQEKGAYAIGYNTDMSKFAPNAYLTAPIWNWGPFYVKTAEQVLNGTWKTEQYWGGMKDNTVDLAPMSKLVPESVQKLVLQVKGDIISGRFRVFEGPIYDKNGKLQVKPGEIISDVDLMNMNWFVQGVAGSIPKQ